MCHGFPRWLVPLRSPAGQKLPKVAFRPGEIALKGNLLLAPVSEILYRVRVMECGVHSSGVSFAALKRYKDRGHGSDTTTGRGRRKTRVLEKMMASRIPFLLALCFTAHLQGPSGAQPVSGSELADFKDLLQRIESKVELAEKEGIERDLEEANEEPAGDAAELISSWDGEYSRPSNDGIVGRVNWQLPEKAPATAVRNKLGRFFNAPRRLSSCFGQRLDRIGSVSGLGCNRRHK